MTSTQSSTGANVARSRQNGLGRLAAWCYDHRRRVLAGWLLAVVAVIGLAQWAGSRLDNNFALGSSPSQQAQNLLASRFPSQKGDSADVVLRSPSRLDSPANAATIGRLVRSLQPLAHVSGVESPLAAGASRQLSPDRRIGFVVVQFDAAAADLPASAVRRVIDTAGSFAHQDLQVAVGGAPVEQVVSAAPGSSEMIGLVAAVVVMLLRLRVGGGHGPADPHRPGRGGHGLRDSRRAQPPHHRARLRPGHDDHDRPRRRHRLRPVRRHPLPPGTGRAATAPRRHHRGPLHGRARRALRRGHGGHRPARAVRGGPAVHGRPRGCDDRRGRPGAGGRAHPFAGDLRLRRAAIDRLHIPGLLARPGAATTTGGSGADGA